MACPYCICDSVRPDEPIRAGPPQLGEAIGQGIAFSVRAGNRLRVAALAVVINRDVYEVKKTSCSEDLSMKYTGRFTAMLAVLAVATGLEAFVKSRSQNVQ
jgi:hypothetical protein